MVQISTKKLVEPKSSDKVLYYYKLIKHEPLANKCHPLGTQGAIQALTRLLWGPLKLSNLTSRTPVQLTNNGLLISF